LENPAGIALRWKWESSAPQEGYIQRIWDPETRRAYAPEEGLPPAAKSSQSQWEFLSLPPQEMEEALRQRLAETQSPRLIQGIRRLGSVWEISLGAVTGKNFRSLHLKTFDLKGQQGPAFHSSNANAFEPIRITAPSLGGTWILQVEALSSTGERLTESRLLAAPTSHESKGSSSMKSSKLLKASTEGSR
jgi:hypothetical protein